MCFVVDFFPNPTPPSFFLSLWWWIESILPNYCLDVTIKSGVCLRVYHLAQDFQAYQTTPIISPSPSSEHHMLKDILKPPPGLRAGRTRRSSAANPVTPSSGQTPSKVCPSFSCVSFIAFSKLQYSWFQTRHGGCRTGAGTKGPRANGSSRQNL